MKKLSILLMVPVVAVLATGTIIEKYHGNEFATEHTYASWWFILLLALVAAGCIAAILREKMWHTPHRMLIYSSAVVILLGGGLTTWTGSHGEMTLLPGQPNDTYMESDSTARQLPFSVTLDNFEVVTYPGSQSPMDFVSHIVVNGETADISMNNIYRRQGYRLYQADYTPDGSSVLSVSYDPIGIAVTYCGYLLLIAGLVVMFLSPRSHFRRLLKALPLLLLLVGGAVSAAPSTLPRQTADRMGRIMVLYKGRICPLQTVAKDYTTKLCSKATYQGLTPEQVLSGWIFYHSEWADEPIIKIKGAELRRQLGLNGRYATYNQLAPQLSGGNNAMPGSTEGIPDKKRRAAEEKVNLVQMVANSQLLKIYPVADSTGTIGWYSQNDPLPLSVDSDEYIFIRKQLGYCQELVVKGDYETLGQVFDKTCEYQQKKAAAILPAPNCIAAERFYNRLTTGRWLYMLVISLGLLSFAIALYSPKSGKGKLSMLNFRLAFCLVALLTAFLLLVFILRWIVGGHAPMAGGFDSMTLMSMVIGIVALCTACRHPMAPPIGLLTMGFCLLVAMMSGSNPPVTNLMPVLSSPLLSLHVTVIMTAYALFFFAMLGSIAALIKPALRQTMERSNLLMLYPAVALLAVGIIIGAVWANISWGNYWSWDPKEVWALITLLVYLYPLHMSQCDNHSSVRFHVWCVAAFLSVIITYFGVNLLLGGIHAYN